MKAIDTSPLTAALVATLQSVIEMSRMIRALAALLESARGGSKFRTVSNTDVPVPVTESEADETRQFVTSISSKPSVTPSTTLNIEFFR